MIDFDIKDAVGRDFSTPAGELKILRFLGKGKSGYSYLAENRDRLFVLKLMHYEEVSCYSFNGANKADLETEAYGILKELGIPVPELILSVPEEHYLLKEFVDGTVATEYIIDHEIPPMVLKELFAMAGRLEAKGINIDYFPNNFVVKGEDLFYIDYEINPYKEDWNLVNWGIWYWANGEGMKKFRDTGDASHINSDCDGGIPRKENFRNQVDQWIRTFGK